jgi:hypothetical protein
MGVDRDTLKRVDRLRKRDSLSWLGPIGDCPNCARILSRGPLYDISNYCYHCGQKLDWGIEANEK